MLWENCDATVAHQVVLVDIWAWRPLFMAHMNTFQWSKENDCKSPLPVKYQFWINKCKCNCWWEGIAFDFSLPDWLWLQWALLLRGERTIPSSQLWKVHVHRLGLRAPNSANTSTSWTSQETPEICVLKNMPLASMTTLETCKYYTFSKIPHIREQTPGCLRCSTVFSFIWHISFKSGISRKKRKLVALGRFFTSQRP